jgi:hypothetical protein
LNLKCDILVSSLCFFKRINLYRYAAWHRARRMYNRIPWVRELPAYVLGETTPLVRAYHLLTTSTFISLISDVF